jgi:crotonobetainyl-CoA:carnitine CoA-transferase CaiB-like acyl-CoA transferase
LATLIGGDKLAADTRFHSSAGRNAHREEILRLVREWTMAQESVAACTSMLDNAGVPSAPVQTIDQVVNDPQIAARGMIVEQDHPVLGKIRLPNLPFNFSGSEPLAPRVAPDLGQHNRKIAADLGFSEDEIAAMEANGTLYSDMKPSLG